MTQRTLVLVKPDGVKKGLIGEVISRLERKGLKIAAMRMLQMDEALARRHYAVHEGKPFFAGLVEFITSGPIVAVVVEGDRVVEAVHTRGLRSGHRREPGPRVRLRRERADGDRALLPGLEVVV